MSDTAIKCSICDTVMENPKWYVSSNPHWGVLTPILCEKCVPPYRSIIYYDTREAAELARIKDVL